MIQAQNDVFKNFIFKYRNKYFGMTSANQNYIHEEIEDNA
jgi:hypothetical protein